MSFGSDDPVVLRPWEVLDFDDEVEGGSELCLDFPLLRHQKQFVDDTTTPEIALVGGFGCGKTDALVHKTLTLAALNAPYQRQGITNLVGAPSDRQIREVVQPRWELRLEQYGIKHTRKSSPDLTYTLHYEEGDVRILMCSVGGDTEKLRGIEASFIGIDEADTMRSDKLNDLWVTFTSRLRGCGEDAHYQLFATTTPEGFGFCQQRFEEDLLLDPTLAADRRLVRGRTVWNPFNGPNYVKNLERQYPAHLLPAYLNGEFVNLNGSIVYRCYDKDKNTSTLTLADVNKNTETLWLGVDFNVNGMSCITMVERAGTVHVIDELIGHRGTQELADAIQTRYIALGYKVIVFPDPACTQRKTSTLDTDLIILKRNMLPVRYMPSHPPIKDRVNAVNAMLENAAGERRLLINPVKAPLLVKCLRTQPYNLNGDPKKDMPIGSGAQSTYIDGPVDGLGYCIYSTHPIRREGQGPIRLLGT